MNKEPARLLLALVTCLFFIVLVFLEDGPWSGKTELERQIQAEIEAEKQATFACVYEQLVQQNATSQFGAYQKTLGPEIEYSVRRKYAELEETSFGEAEGVGEPAPRPSDEDPGAELGPAVLSGEEARSNILDDVEKRHAAEEALNAYLTDRVTVSDYAENILYFKFISAEVNAERTNFYIRLQLIADPDPDLDYEVAKDRYLNHFYTVNARYVAEYDPKFNSYVEGEPGRFYHNHDFYMCEEPDGTWTCIGGRFLGAVPVD